MDGVAVEFARQKLEDIAATWKPPDGVMTRGFTVVSHKESLFLTILLSIDGDEFKIDEGYFFHAFTYHCQYTRKLLHDRWTRNAWQRIQRDRIPCARHGD